MTYDVYMMIFEVGRILAIIMFLISLILFFVLKMGLGVFGVAVATCISQAASAITSIIYAYKKIEYF